MSLLPLTALKRMTWGVAFLLMTILTASSKIPVDKVEIREVCLFRPRSAKGA